MMWSRADLSLVMLLRKTIRPRTTSSLRRKTHLLRRLLTMSRLRCNKCSRLHCPSPLLAFKDLDVLPADL
jgi:hypothetical protein